MKTKKPFDLQQYRVNLAHSIKAYLAQQEARNAALDAEYKRLLEAQQAIERGEGNE